MKRGFVGWVSETARGTYGWLRDYFLGENPTFGTALVPMCFLSMLLFTRSPRTNFIFDEQEALLANPYVRAVMDPHTKIEWIQAFTRDFWGLTPERTIGSYRPIPDLVWRGLWSMGATDTPFLHHWVCVLLHGVCGALMTMLVLKLTKRRGTAWLAGTIFVASAVVTEAVSGVVGISDVLGGLGAILGLLALTQKLWLMPLGVFVATMIGLYSKETALVMVPLIPFAAVMIAPMTHPGRPMRWLRGVLALIAAFSAFYLYVELRRMLFPVHTPDEISEQASRGTGLVNEAKNAFLRWYAQPGLPRDKLNNPLIDAVPELRVAGGLRVYWRGLAQVVFPWTLSGDYSAPQEPVPSRPWFLESVLGALCLVGPMLAAPVLGFLAWLRARDRASRVKPWMVLALAGALGAVLLAALRFDSARWNGHRMMFATPLVLYAFFGLALAVGGIAWVRARRSPTTSPALRDFVWAPLVLAIFTAAFVLALNLDSPDYKPPLSFFATWAVVFAFFLAFLLGGLFTERGERGRRRSLWLPLGVIGFIAGFAVLMLADEMQWFVGDELAVLTAEQIFRALLVVLFACFVVVAIAGQVTPRGRVFLAFALALFVAFFFDDFVGVFDRLVERWKWLRIVKVLVYTCILASPWIIGWTHRTPPATPREREPRDDSWGVRDERPGLAASGTAHRAVDMRPLAGVGIVWIVLSYFPVSNIPVLLPTVRAERFWYFPIVGSAIFLALVFTWLRDGGARRGKLALRVVAGLVVVFLGFQFFAARRHAFDYNDDLTFWEATRRAVPRSAKAHLNYSVMLGARGDLAGRYESNKIGYELAPTWPMASVYLGDTLCRWALTFPEGERAEKLSEALEDYLRGFDLAPNDINLIALGLQCVWDSGIIAKPATEELPSEDFPATPREKLSALADKHPGSWLKFLIDDVLLNGEKNHGVDAKYRPRGYNEGPKE